MGEIDPLYVKFNVLGFSVEVTIPNKVVGSILGRGGSNIRQICELFSRIFNIWSKFT